MSDIPFKKHQTNKRPIAPKHPAEHTRTEQIIKKLQDDLAFGQYQPGSKLPTEKELMNLYQVGRSTIREAVKTLESIGILNVRQGAGTFVNLQIEHSVTDRLKMNRALLKEVNDVRYLLEKEILIQAMRYRTNADIANIKEALEDRKEATIKGRFNLALDADLRFHCSIATASHNQILDELYKHFTVHLRDYFKSRDRGDTSHFALVHGLHELLFQHILNKNEEEGLRTLDKLLTNNYWRLGYEQ